MPQNNPVSPAKPHIGIFGKCNSGKSTFLNAITGSDVSLVSHIVGTTTDIVKKTFEIDNYGPVVFMDTGGIDDCSVLGPQRVARTMSIVEKIDMAVIIYRTWSPEEQRLENAIKEYDIPVTRIRNIFGAANDAYTPSGFHGLQADLLSMGEGFRNLFFDTVRQNIPPESFLTPRTVPANIGKGDIVLLICPIDKGAPAGRLILPQVQVLRELLDIGAIAIVIQPEQMEGYLRTGTSPNLVITDSQVVAEVDRVFDGRSEVTTFSILLAGSKGDMDLYRHGLEKVDILKPGDKVIIAENCSHHTTCDDIGRVKIPAWLDNYATGKLEYTIIPGLDALPENLTDYALMVQCGGCMVTSTQLRNRIRRAARAGLPVTNYGMLIRKITSSKR